MMAKKTSPTQRSLKLMRDRGYLCQVTEKWNPFAKVRQDLLGFGDILAIGIIENIHKGRGGEIILIQTTSYSNMSARKTKILESKNAHLWVFCGGKILLHGWKKKGSRWEPTEKDLTNATRNKALGVSLSQE